MSVSSRVPAPAPPVRRGLQQQGRLVVAVTGWPGRPQPLASLVPRPTTGTSLHASWIIMEKRGVTRPRADRAPPSPPPALQGRESGPQPHTAASHVTAELNPLPGQAAGCVDGCPHPGAADPADPAHTPPHGTPPAAAPQRSREPGGNSQKLCLIVRFKQKRGKDCTQKLPEQTSAFKSPDVCQTQKTEILGPAPTSDTAWRDAPAAVGTCAWPLQPALACPLGSSPGQQG